MRGARRSTSRRRRIEQSSARPSKPAACGPETWNRRNVAPVSPRERCPGSGMRLVSRSYVVRKIESADREKYNLWAKHAEERGELDEAAGIRTSLAEWEKEQGLTRERLVCG